MLILKNKKAGFNYELLEKYSAGISLFGFEVKALRAKKASFEGSYISILDDTNTVLLKNFSITPLQLKNVPEKYNIERIRTLLLKKEEIKRLKKDMKSSRLTIIPVAIHQIERGLMKLEFSLARGKKKYDKRQSLKKKDNEREIKRFLKNK